MWRKHHWGWLVGIGLLVILAGSWAWHAAFSWRAARPSVEPEANTRPPRDPLQLHLIPRAQYPPPPMAPPR